MSHRLEVLPGPGTVVRHGDVVVWAGPSSSAALLSFLAQSARNVGDSTLGGLQIVEHIAGILSTRDPEPGAPFAVVGPAPHGWVTLLHGPVQLWDGARWLAPTPDPGWLRSDVAPQPAVSIGPAGGASPRLSPESPYDLVAGTVPGGGLILVPDPAMGPGAPTRAYRDTSPGRQDGPPTLAGARPAAGPLPIGHVPYSGPLSSPGSLSSPDEPPPGPFPPPGAEREPAPVAASPGSTFADEPGSGTAGPAAAAPGAREWVSLRAAPAAWRPALPIGGAVTPDGRPQVSGVRCPEGHLNSPAATVCATCNREIAPGQPRTVGPRPVLGVLIAADNGETFRLDADQVLGSDPSTDPGVAAGRLRGVILRGAPGQLAPAHTEIRLLDWAPTVIDRGSAGGTFLVPVGTTGWVRLAPYQPTALRPGSHLSVGQRVLTFVSPWPG